MQIVVAQPGRTSADPFARVFQDMGVLRRYLIWARRVPAWVKPEIAVSSTILGGLRVAGPILLPLKMGENWEYKLYPWFGRWSARYLRPGDWVFSSYGYCNEAFEKAHKSGGINIYNAGNSHPKQFWNICCEENQRWGVSADPILRSQHERALAMVELSDYYFCASGFVKESYRAQGVPEERLIMASRPFDPTVFKPVTGQKTDETFRVVSPGTINLRKGTLYLLQAFEKLRREFKRCELILTRTISEECKHLIRPYEHLIRWRPSLSHPELAELFQQSHVYVLPSLEEGLARTAIEAMACGLPVIVTSNTGLADYVQDGLSGWIVPLRDPEAIFQRLLTLATNRSMAASMGQAAFQVVQKRLLPQHFATTVTEGLQRIAASKNRGA